MLALKRGRARPDIGVALLYLVPRALPIGLLIAVGLRFGVTAVGVISVPLSLWQFCMTITDWGASQWALTRRDIPRSQAAQAFKGRIVMSLAAGVVLVAVTHLNA